VREIQYENGYIRFYKLNETNEKTSIKENFECYVGLVSGLESVYKNEELGNVNIINGKKENKKYIMINKYPSENEDINKHLYTHKEELKKRKIRKFTEKNWYEWGALRNIKIMEEHKGEEVIYIHNLTRKKEIAFKEKMEYFGGNLIVMIPKKDNIHVEEIVEKLNSKEFRERYTYSGRFKIGQRELMNVMI